MNIDWSKAPEGFPLWLEGTNEEHRKHSGWYRDAGQVFEGAYGGQWRACREGQFFTVHRNPGSPSWTGEGLPPVGTVCEFQGDCAKCPSDPWHKELHDGVKCTVIAHFKSKTLDLVAFTFVKADGNSELEQSLPGALRPILTPEQIAAAERESAVRVMMSLNPDENPNQSLSKWLCEALYDAGYRKQVAP